MHCEGLKLCNYTKTCFLLNEANFNGRENSKGLSLKLANMAMKICSKGPQFCLKNFKIFLSSPLDIN